MAAAPTAARPPYGAIALVSATALAYELLLLRLFALAQWHHFAYMVISLALLGYGVSGTFVTLLQRPLLARFAPVFQGSLLLFGISAVGCALIAQRIPFNPEEVLWDLRQPQRLLLIYLLLALPFFFAATAIALALMHFTTAIARVYAADLLGAGAGAALLIGLLMIAFPVQALGLLGIAAMLALVLATLELRARRRGIWLLTALLAAPLLWTVAHHSTPVISPYKPLSQMLRIPGTRINAEHSSPLGVITVVESPQVPLRHAPGLSLNARSEPPAQLALFTDGDGMSVITEGGLPRERYAYLDQLGSALPYHLYKPAQVLVLGAGGGEEVRQALWQGAPAVTAVELNPQLVGLLRGQFADFAGHLYDRPEVRVEAAEARGFVVGSDRHYDLIQIAFLDAFGAAAAGLRALNESYLYTVEALGELLAHLQPGGWLALTRWIDLPPRDLPRLLLTAATALEAQGVDDPGARMILIRGWQTGTLLIKRGAVIAEEVERTRAFAQARSFDIAWAPGIRPDEVNRFNQLAEPYFYQAARAIFGPERATFVERYKFDLQPASDDRPFFFHFARLSTLPELLRLRAQGGMPLIEWGYVVLVATLVQALVVSLVLILLPLKLLRRQHAVSPRGSGRVLGFFVAIGLAFLFIEIAFIQRFSLLLHHPVYAAAIVLSGFLVFAGLGSAAAGRFARRGRHGAGVRWAVAGIVLLTLACLWGLPPLFAAIMAWPPPARVAVSLLVIAPLAFCMGFPFPLALDRLARTAPALVPWAWGVNGCASVISAALATLFAVHFGFSTVLLTALALYALAALWLPAAPPAGGPAPR